MSDGILVKFTSTIEAVRCASLVSENPIKVSKQCPKPDAYETIWLLYLYLNNINKFEEASNYFTMTYESIGKATKKKSHKHPENNTHPKFFYCRIIIKVYEASLHQ